MKILCMFFQRTAKGFVIAEERWDSLGGGPQGVHGEEEGESFGGEVVVLRVEVPPEFPPPVFVEMRDTGAFPALNFFGGHGQQFFSPGGSGGKEA